ncbi:TadE/TadG family type IV pilus assembly protein [Ruegeria arenilitoris]|uniref:TadE/TadG family type IV pilus assembly protein n=1 Tax=Ruegeria arenilitoris TaxID=1173585 RepID=UPI00147B1983|nr:TadE/TadG family type IV pilus assembly protein [Ruegeria arenilitoris]
MTHRIERIKRDVSRLTRDEDGSTIVEMAVVLPLFLLIFLGLIDFGRLAFHYIAAEKTAQVAARMAAVMPPACDGIPTTNFRGGYTDVSGPRFGTNCSFATGVCFVPTLEDSTCDGDDPASVAAQTTRNEIWNMLQFAVPNDPTANFDAGNIEYTYEFDPQMNFLGGPYVPNVTVTIEALPFRFVSPLGALAALAVGGDTPETDALTDATTDFKIFSDFSATLPGEDLANGTNG